MNTNFKPPYDESKEVESIFDFYNVQIFRVNTSNSNLYLQEGKYFSDECVKRVHENGVIRLVVVIDTVPPLSAILKFVSTPWEEVKWGIYAVVLPMESETLKKITPILTYGLGITPLKNKFTLKVFDSSNRNNLENIIKWMDESMDSREPQIDTGNLPKS